MKGKLYGIGIGPGDADLLTLKAVKALKKVNVIFVPKSKEQASTALKITSAFINESVTIKHLEFPMSKDINIRIASRKKNADIIAAILNEGNDVAFLTLGDPMLYSTYSYVLEHLEKDYEVENIPGIYSFSAISNVLSKSLCKGNETMTVICNWGEKEYSLIQKSDNIICMKLSAYHKDLYTFLKDNSNYDFCMITDVGKEKQREFTDISILKDKVPYFSTAIIKKKHHILQNTQH